MELDAYEEANRILEQARQMFEQHSNSMTGHKWDFDIASDGVKTIWILKAYRTNQQSTTRE